MPTDLLSNSVARRVNTEKYIHKANHFDTEATTSSRHRKINDYNLCLPQCHRSHYQLGYQESIVPSMALREAQVVILYFFDKIQLHQTICRLY